MKTHTTHILDRLIRPKVKEAMLDTPVTLIEGPRQAGKTTLAREIANDEMRYLTLDDEATRTSVDQDPVGMIRQLDRAIIDEVQRAPALLLAIKKSVDEDRRPGRFLLTGSANLMTLPTVADSLAGRMETLTLLPLSQTEIYGGRQNWLDNAFKGHIAESNHLRLGDDLVQSALKGGYPEAIERQTERRRMTWARQYMRSIIERDVREIANITMLDELPRFFSAVAQTAGQLCNYSQLAGQTGLDGKTAAKYIGVLEQLYLVKRIPVWANNQLNRIVKTPKLQFVDSGLLASLLRMTSAEFETNRTRFGQLLETFVYGELLKHSVTADDDYIIMHYRDHEQYEVDFVIENTMGDIIGVEVKAAASVRSTDKRGLKRLASLAADKFKLGVILYDGDQTLPLNDNIWAVPISSLWAA